MNKKKCFKCNKVKALGEFYAHPEMPDGHLNKCKECTKKDNIDNRNKNIEYYREYDRQRTDQPKRVKAREEYANKIKEEHPERIRLHSKKYIKENPEKRKAHHAVSNAIRDGRLFKEPCEICGKIKVEAHHEDYSKPLKVRWLCKKHHMAEHRKLNQKQREERK